ncbi:hypothetical protein [Sinorhizobium chiapasense]|uniref:Uncharacterized protein n=1 Tax=Sinorhizobium chiapasense TaxID=501572 RepID=A0ABZ2B8Z4_9HYPH
MSSDYIGVQIADENDKQVFAELGLKPDELNDGLYIYDASSAPSIYRMCECLRDLGVPFSSHRTGGADYVIEAFRDRGYVQGNFKRANFFGNDTVENAPFAIEEF